MPGKQGMFFPVSVQHFCALSADGGRQAESSAPAPGQPKSKQSLGLGRGG